MCACTFNSPTFLVATLLPYAGIVRDTTLGIGRLRDVESPAIFKSYESESEIVGFFLLLFFRGGRNTVRSFVGSLLPRSNTPHIHLLEVWLLKKR